MSKCMQRMTDPNFNLQVSDAILWIMRGYGSSFEAFVILVHVYVLAMATLHQSRSRDRYQGRVLGLCFVVSWICSVTGGPRSEDPEETGHLLSLLYVGCALLLSGSAVVHEGMSWWEGRVRGRDDEESQRHKGTQT